MGKTLLKTRDVSHILKKPDVYYSTNLLGMSYQHNLYHQILLRCSNEMGPIKKLHG